ncbi:MAG: FKBP-type peptidyl-prolyl cis-trans isomerase [Saprospiraceae bacterium]|nr:FKBP-type peptidyl-prolyl cis-trans isomerase [Saprospiraceae bacterium]
MKKPFKLIIALSLILRGVSPTFASDSLSIEGFLSTKKIKAEKMLDGIFYTLNTEGVGEVPRQGDFVKIRYVGKTLAGNVFDQSPVEEPYVFQLGNGQVIEGWNKAIQRLKMGTKVTLYVPAHLAYGSIGIGNIIPPNSPLIYEIELMEVLTKPQYEAHLRKLEDKYRKMFDNRLSQQFDMDKKHINDYALLHRLRVNRTPSGLSYIVTKAGKGNLPTTGNKVTFHYNGMFLSDQIFDETKDKLPKTVTLGDEKLLAGLEEGLKFFNEGAEGYILIPSKLAYGATPVEEGKVVIAPHSVLIYQVQVVSVK